MAVGGCICNAGRWITWRSIYGTPPSGTVSIIEVGTGTTTPAVTQTGLSATLGSRYGVLSGYPTYDETNQKVTTRYLIPATGLNGQMLTEIGEFFSGTTPKGMFSRDVFTGISKSGSDEIAFILVSQIT